MIKYFIDHVELSNNDIHHIYTRGSLFINIKLFGALALCTVLPFQLSALFIM